MNSDVFTKPISPRLIALDETWGWEISDLAGSELVERIETVYLFDANQVTYACEMTPSYALNPLYTRVIFKDGFNSQKGESSEADNPEADNPEADNPEADNIRDVVESNADNELMYLHVTEVETLIEELTSMSFRYIVLTEGSGDPDESYEERMEAVIEHYACNHAL